MTAAFRAMAHGVGAQTAQAQTIAFYRAGGGEWTRGLSHSSHRRAAAFA